MLARNLPKHQQYKSPLKFSELILSLKLIKLKKIFCVGIHPKPVSCIYEGNCKAIAVCMR